MILNLQLLFEPSLQFERITHTFTEITSLTEKQFSWWLNVQIITLFSFNKGIELLSNISFNLLHLKTLKQCVFRERALGKFPTEYPVQSHYQCNIDLIDRNYVKIGLIPIPFIRRPSRMSYAALNFINDCSLDDDPWMACAFHFMLGASYRGCGRARWSMSVLSPRKRENSDLRRFECL